MVSVIIPTYKPGRYILECLNSVHQQKLDKKKYEVIIVLNGPKGKYYDLISREVSLLGTTNFRLYHIEERGVSIARNLGLDIAKGKYIAFIDDDDFISDSYLLDLYNKVKHLQNTIIVSNVKTYDSNKKTGKDYISRTFVKCQGIKYSIIKYRGFLSSSCAKIIPIEIIGRDRFNVNVSISEDALFMFTISKRIERIILSDSNSIYFRRLRVGSAIRKEKKNIDKIILLFKSIKNYSVIYYKSPTQYSFTLYTTRVLAAIKVYLKSYK